MLTPMARPTLTAEDRAKAKRLKMLWNARKADLALTQVKAARELKITQPTFSQYLNAIIPLNTDAVLKFADLLGVSAAEIDPRLKNVQSLQNARDARAVRVRVPLIGSISGKSIMKHSALILDEVPEEGIYVGIAVDGHMLNQAGIPKGSTLLLDIDADPFVKLRNIVVRIRGEDGFTFLQYLESTDTSIKVKDPVQNRFRTLRLSAIAQAHLVYSITMPA